MTKRMFDIHNVDLDSRTGAHDAIVRSTVESLGNRQLQSRFITARFMENQTVDRADHFNSVSLHGLTQHDMVISMTPAAYQLYYADEWAASRIRLDQRLTSREIDYWIEMQEIHEHWQKGPLLDNDIRKGLSQLRVDVSRIENWLNDLHEKAQLLMVRHQRLEAVAGKKSGKLKKIADSLEALREYRIPHLEGALNLANSNS